MSVVPRFSLVVVAYHRPGELEDLLRASASPALEQVVVNVESDPVIGLVARRAGAQLVDVVGNPGYAAAVNAGVAAAGGEVVVYANDDVACDGDALVELAGLVREDVVAVPRVVDVLGLPERTIQARPTPWSLLVEWAVLPDRPLPLVSSVARVEKWRLPLSCEPVAAASAVVVAAPRALLLAEPLPEAYFLYWEEAEWFARIARRGVVVDYHPEISVTHLGGRRVASAAKQELLARNAVRCLRRLEGRRAAAFGWPIVTCWHARLVATGWLRLADARVRGGDAGVAAARAVLVARRAGLVAAGRAWREIA